MVTYLHEKARAEGTPVSGTFELTQRCNFNCKMCYVHEANAKPDSLTAQQWLELGRQAQKAGTVFLLIRSDFDEIYEGLIKMGFLISINSNGSLIDKHIEIFKKYPPLKFNISIYGSDNDAYYSLCGVNKYEKVISNIDLLRENGIEVRVNLVATPANGRCYKEIIDICEKRDMVMKPTAYAYPAIRLGKKDNEARFDPITAARYAMWIDKYLYEDEFYNTRLKRFAELGGSKIKNNKVRCRAGSAAFWITADGIMRPCGMMPDLDAFPLRDGFDKAWDETKVFTANIKTPSKCIDCEYSGICTVCAAMCKAETGSYDGVPEYVCKMTKQIHEIAKAEEKEVNNK